ncbi:DUF423 domain-containing protein [Pollutimonas thiosulfatoxidans]|uniref:DUF423 domain-containing protein n=1 Tax=Pollutimonas thiosulfatoxidans TaxID=2028345 RepID=A0A410GC28_9BURK|nr:DUF423 domain-containing protein [Pollutimonas thiosulfatoxidans]MBF6617075.1 DUF423 domain-containing protein [Candidimonas sp.]QAA93829.1 hypothetical protein CKA81_08240 [Pollutimonas thiosulfatoxidans]
MTDRLLVIFAALTLMVGVGTGAFGAHALKRILSPDMLAIWQTAVQYQMVHGLGMLLIALLATRYGSPLLHYAGMLMFAGVVVFSGSLYLLAFTGIRWLGAITPFGGLAFIAAWAMVALAAWRSAP